MTEEEVFIRAVELVESRDNQQAWGDSGRAAGAWQDHPSMYATWGPRPADFGGVERDWNWAFRFATARFYQTARRDWPEKTDLEIAMALHLHGQLRWDGNEEAYAGRFTTALESLMHNGH